MAAELLAGAAAAGGSLLGSVANWGLNSLSAKKEREWNEQMMDKQNEWSLDMWNKTNEYNTPSAQFQRLKDAGLNPLYFGLDGSSANGLESAQALGYERAQAPMFDNPIATGLDAYTQQKSLQKEIELKNAEIDKIKSDTVGQDLDNEFKDKTMAARVEAENLANSLTKQQIAKVNDERGKIKAEIKKIAAETDSEVAKKLLYEAEARLDDMKAEEIVELLPYQKLLMEAQTDAQKASAAASWAKAAIDKGLFEAGYVDKQIDLLAEEIRKEHGLADNEEAQAALTQFKASVRNGTAITVPPGSSKAKVYWTYLVDKFYQSMAITGECLSGLSGVAGIVVGAGLKGAADNVKKTPPSWFKGSNLNNIPSKH